MEAGSALKKDWVLTPSAFAKLLAAFDSSDEGRAALEYEAARERLVKLFRWRNVHDAEEAADETLNRVARKLEEGEEVRNVSHFIGGVARLLLLERLKSQTRKQVAIEDAPPEAFVVQPEEFGGSEGDARLDCFNSCLRALPVEMREIVVEYYSAESEGAARIKHRKLMAERMKLEMNALRNRALRARARLEECVRNCLGGVL